MFGMNRDQVLGFLRHLITFVGGILVARGNLDPGAVETIGGAIVTVVGAILSFTSPEKTTIFPIGPPTPPPDTTKPVDSVANSG